jgi:hypothetical protein
MTQIVLEIDNESDTKLFLDLAERLNISFKTNKIANPEISNEDWNQLIHKGKSFDFLNDDEEDIYSDKNLKVKFL